MRAGLRRDAAKCIVMAARMLHGLCFGEEAGVRNPLFFRVKWLQPAMKGTSCVRRLRLRSFHPRISSSVFCNERSSMRVLNLSGCRLQWNGCMIVVIWCCHVHRCVQVCDVMLRNAL